MAYALSKGLGVIFCIGEKLEEREANETHAVNSRQLKVGFGGVVWASVEWGRVTRRVRQAKQRLNQTRGVNSRQLKVGWGLGKLTPGLLRCVQPGPWAW